MNKVQTKKQALGLLNNGLKAMSNNSLTKKLLELDANDQQSDYSQQLSMFGDNRKGSKKSQRPVKGYKWMIFTFFMIIILSLCVIFADEVIQQIDNAKNSGKNFFKEKEFVNMDLDPKDNYLSWKEVSNEDHGWIKQFNVVGDKKYVDGLSKDGTTLDEDEFKKLCKGENNFMDYSEFQKLYTKIHKQQKVDTLAIAQEKWQKEANKIAEKAEEARIAKEAVDAETARIAKETADAETEKARIAQEKADKVKADAAAAAAAAAGGNENPGSGDDEDNTVVTPPVDNGNEDDKTIPEFEDLDEELEELLRE